MLESHQSITLHDSASLRASLAADERVYGYAIKDMRRMSSLRHSVDLFG
jgi:hypothetical protein